MIKINHGDIRKNEHSNQNERQVENVLYSTASIN